MVVDVIDLDCINTFEPERHTPITRNPNRKNALAVTLQWMHPEARKIHLLRSHGLVQSSQYSLQLRYVISNYLRRAITFIERLQSLVTKGADHRLIVLCRATHVKQESLYATESGRRGTSNVTPNTIDLKLRQIETVRSVVDHVRRESDIPSDKTEELDRELANIIQRLRDLRDRMENRTQSRLSVESMACRSTSRKFRRSDASAVRTTPPQSIPENHQLETAFRDHHRTTSRDPSHRH